MKYFGVFHFTDVKSIIADGLANWDYVPKIGYVRRWINKDKHREELITKNGTENGSPCYYILAWSDLVLPESYRERFLFDALVRHTTP